MAGPPEDHPAFAATVVGEADGASTLALAGELDVGVCEEVRAFLDSALDRGGRDLTVDMAEVRFLDSRTIGVFIAVMKRATAAGGSLVLRDPQPHVRKSLVILGLAQAFGLIPGEDPPRSR